MLPTSHPPSRLANSAWPPFPGAPGALRNPSTVAAFPYVRNWGFTLAETATALVVASLATLSLAPSLSGVTDRLAAEGARESLAGMISEARTRSIGTGDVTVVVAGPPWFATLNSGRSTVRELPLDESGVTVELGTGNGQGTKLRKEFSFNALGLGKVASQTLTFSRGKAKAQLIVSSYGRIRRK